MILLTAILVGLLVGQLRARQVGSAWQVPELQHSWLVPVAFLPQFFAFYLPASRERIPDAVAAICLVSSQIGLLIFCLLNRHQGGLKILGAGLLLNLLVITANGGFMPLSMETAEQLIPKHILENMKIGSRLDASSKDILLPFDAMVFPWLSDRFPAWFPYRFAFSLGDLIVGMGAYLVFATGSGSLILWQNQRTRGLQNLS
jgi:hypothetical protein